MARQAEKVMVVQDAMRLSPHAFARSVSRLSLAAGVALIATTSVAAQQPAADGPSKALEGRWKLELYLGAPSARTTPMAGQINGELAFSNTAWWNPSDRFGRHSLDLQSFFGRSFLRPANVTPFGPGDTSMVTEISGNVRRDSVNIDFIPRIDHGGVSMWGRFWGDSAKGKWNRRGTDGDGDFVLRRISSEPVSVAAIPDGRPVAVAVAVAVAPEKPLTKAQLRAKERADALTKTKADAEARALARTQAQEKAKADALAKRQMRDSAVAEATLVAKAKKDSQIQALAAAKATRDSTAAAKLAATKAKRDSVAAARLAARAPQPAATPATTTTVAASTSATAPATVPATAPATAPPAATTRAPNAPPPAASTLTSTSTLATAASRPAATPARPGTTAVAASAPAAPVTIASTVPGAAPLRVRVYDIASNSYFSTKYSLKLPDGHWLYGTLKTGANPDGWGPAVVRAPGKYEVEVTDFICGDKIWFLKDKITKAVAIEPGIPTEVTIDIDVTTAPARPSLDNKAGAKCTEPPGGKT